MSRLRRARDEFDANRRARTAAEQRAGQVWNDTVLRRLSERKLQPLADEERRFVQALTAYDMAIDFVLTELSNY
ncbi:hypothetical protein [Nocardia brasiliensis]|uniref:Uncharacterized protein n=1 Tax=Nocardia brasiliensis (strain ATCC 700358 / HUJEG-1) TaxID=1133849 RepID=K0EWW6_NOCB7|nr:hypothetical protein [Nocardia brasiliensis]AFU01977.1 hypothetical protein O3I_020090 [Nocardia brasiliensis ATCC 700358]OCF87794.1 hypothetical protein AW168_25305 [Nocardia brasiliensis]